MFDLIVVGAGLSGLQAAYSAQQAGLSVAVIEARDRVGGKTWTVPLASGRGVADLGAAWINDRLQPRIWAYVQKFGLHTVRQRLEGKAIMQSSESERVVYPFGITPEFAEDEKVNLEKIRDHIQRVSLLKEPPNSQDDNVTLDQYVRELGAGPKTIQMVNLWSRVMHGVESSEQSAAWFIDYCRRNKGLLAVRADDQTGGNHMRIITGTQEISKGIANLIGESEIFLSSPVAAIEDKTSKVEVTTRDGKVFMASRCILSLPSTMYSDINISPPLPPQARHLYEATKLGHYNKAIVCYGKPWWRDLGLNGFAMSFVGPAVVIRDTSVDEKECYALTCFVNGREGEKWSKLHDHERRRVVLRQLAILYNVGPESEVFRPIEFFVQIWKHEEYSKGALAPITALGHYTRFQSVYGKPVGNLHFVGTEYSNEWKGYMEGAIYSGEAGARQVLRISGDYTDMTIICGDTEYQVHKAIVCPRSKYFDAMFSHGMQNPATDEFIGTCPESTVNDLHDAINAASAAFPLWRAQSGRTRGRILRRLGDLITENKVDIGRIITAENGKARADAEGEALFCASFFEWFSEEAPRSHGDIVPHMNPQGRIQILKQPIGVCGLITPWNFPMAMGARKIAAALAAGCTVVLKSDGLTPFSSNALGVLGEMAGIPKGVLNIVTALDNTPQLGLALCESTSVQKISFTGSTRVGKLLMKQSSSTLKKLSLELGGNAPFIVFDDADLETAVSSAIISKFKVSGQTCVCANRFYVQDGIYQRFSQRLVEEVKKFKVGNGSIEAVTHGPLTTSVAKVEEHRLECGMVALNTGVISDPAAPFGGVKQSGFGREGSKYGMDDYMVSKTIVTGGIVTTYSAHL
ncbi:hypothetical protein BN1708_013424 [Verticillium longisporum]|uniref:Amine oxidase n=1 Tax=Verticillium longisporum TaxID=100787 RepID=A0A0G4LKG1_VERLO|nr:hypothetical protein BN1708_013424 [Verticillium longisporum]